MTGIIDKPETDIGSVRWEWQRWDMWIYFLGHGGDQPFCDPVNEIAGGVPSAVVDAWTVVDEKEKVVIGDALRGSLNFLGTFCFRGFKLCEIDVDVKGIK